MFMVNDVLDFVSLQFIINVLPSQLDEVVRLTKNSLGLAEGKHTRIEWNTVWNE